MSKSTAPNIVLIAAVSENHVIGKEGILPWSLPLDHENFHRVTKGYPFITGRKSYESPDKLFSTEKNIVLSSNAKYKLPEGFFLASNLSEAISLAADYPLVFVLGGQRIFKEALPLAQFLYLTKVKAKVEGDTYFPKVNWKNWEPIQEVEYPADEKHEFAFTIGEYKRV